MFDPFLAHVGNVDEAGGFDADVHEGAEIGDIPDGAPEDGPHFDVRQFHNVLAGQRGRKIGPGIPAGSHQGIQDVVDGGFPGLQFPGQPGFIHLFPPGGQPGQFFFVLQVFQGKAQLFQDLLGQCVGFRMDGGVIQGRLAPVDPQEPGALGKGSRAQPGHLQQLPTSGEPAVGVPPGHNVAGSGGSDPGHMAEQGGRRGVQVHSHMVHHPFHHPVQGAGQGFLVHIVLVLAHPDGLGIDLHQFRQRILDPPGHGYGTPDGHIVFRQFLLSQFGGGIDGSPGFIGNEIMDVLQLVFLDQPGGKLLCLIGSSAVADGQQGYMVLLDHGQEQGLGLFLLAFALCHLDHPVVQHLAGGIHHRHLAAGPVARIQPHNRMAGQGSLEQQLSQVGPEHLDGLVFRLFRQPAADFPFQGREQQPFPAVRQGFLQLVPVDAGPAEHPPFHFPEGLLFIPHQMDFQTSFLFAPVDGQYPVGRQGPDRFPVIGVHQEGLGLFRIFHQFGLEETVVPQLFPEGLAQGGIFRRQFRHNVPGAGQGVFRGLHPFVRIHIGPGGGQGISLLVPLEEEGGSQGFQAFFPSLLGTGTPFLLVRQIIIFQFCQFLGIFNGFPQVRGQFSLFVDFGQDLFLALHQVPEGAQPFFDGPDLLIQQGAGDFFPVTGDKGDGVAPIQEFHDLFHLPGLDGQFPGNARGDVSLFHWIFSFRRKEGCGLYRSPDSFQAHEMGYASAFKYVSPISGTYSG